MEVVHRCDKCNKKCTEHVQDITASPSRILLVEANKYNRRASSNEVAMKLLIWGHSAPPMRITGSPSPVDPIVYEKAKVLINGSIYLDENQNFSNEDHFVLPGTDEEDVY
ncbi:unnamed protein product [Diamesa serratosioi]